MEQAANSELSTTTLLDVNNDCLLKIFNFLGFDDCMSLADTCTRLAAVSKLTFGKCKKFRFDVDNQNGTGYIDRVFRHIGAYLTTLTIVAYDRMEYVLSKIDENVGNLKNLNIGCLNRALNFSLFKGLDKIEILTLFQSYMENNEHFFTPFCNVKFFNIERCRFGPNRQLLQNYFTDNVKIVSVTYDCPDDFQLEMLPLLINLEKLRLTPERSGGCVFELAYIRDINISVLPQLNQLRSLKICGQGWRSTNVNNVLSELAKKGMLEEFEINGYRFDSTTFAILKSFEKMQLLVLSMIGGKEWNSSFTLPPNLKHLTLEDFRISPNEIATLMKGLTCLENIQIRFCDIVDENGTKIDNFMQKCQLVSNAMGNNTNQQLINVYLPGGFRSVPEVEECITAGRLRFFCNKKYLQKPSQFEIYFPCSSRW